MNFKIFFTFSSQIPIIQSSCASKLMIYVPSFTRIENFVNDEEQKRAGLCTGTLGPGDGGITVGVRDGNEPSRRLKIHHHGEGP